MKLLRVNLRDAVLVWTLFTTTFLWTPTMRMFLKPEVSRWSVLGISGSGREGAYWMFPLAAGLALLFFYLEGRGRLRPLAHSLLLVWHLGITGALAVWSVRAGAEAKFVGAAWGWEVPFPVLTIPFALFSGLAVVLVVREARGDRPVPTAGWAEVDWRVLAVAVALWPVAFGFFRAGEGYDGPVKIAIAITVLQWILLAQGLGAPAAGKSAPTDEARRPGAGADGGLG